MNIKDITLKKGMLKDDVNELISEWLLLEDSVFMGSTYKHDWVCKCGEIIKNRQWQTIKRYDSINCGCAEYEKQEKKYKYEVEKDGDYEYIRSFRKGSDLPSGKNTGNDIYIQIKHKFCERIYETQVGGFINGGHRCNKCCGSYENSFAYHIEVELGEPLEKYWDFEKNTVNPYHITKRNSKKVWIKCQNEEVNELNGLMKKDYHGSTMISCNSFYLGARCRYCKGKEVHKYDSAGYINPHLSKKIVYDSNNNIVDIYKIRLGSSKKYYFKCDECGNISSKPKEVRKMNEKFSCEYCSDGFSIPEKFMGNILKQLNISYIKELSSANVSWINKNVRYDFYIPKLDMIIEVHGKQHYEGDKNWGVSSKDIVINDKNKHALAINNVRSYIQIDCRYSNLKYMRKNVVSQLGNIMNLEKIDWDDAYKKSLRSTIVEVCDIYNKGIKSPKRISQKLNISTSTVTNFLKKGKEIGICDYSKEDVREYTSKHFGTPNKLKGLIRLKNKEEIPFEGLDSLLDILGVSSYIYYKIKENNNTINIYEFKKSKIPNCFDEAEILTEGEIA